MRPRVAAPGFFSRVSKGTSRLQASSDVQYHREGACKKVLKEQLEIALGGSQGHTQSWQNFLEHGATCMTHLGGQQLYRRTI